MYINLYSVLPWTRCGIWQSYFCESIRPHKITSYKIQQVRVFLPFLNYMGISYNGVIEIIHVAVTFFAFTNQLQICYCNTYFLKLLTLMKYTWALKFYNTNGGIFRMFYYVRKPLMTACGRGRLSLVFPDKANRNLTSIVFSFSEEPLLFINRFAPLLSLNQAEIFCYLQKIT